MFYNSFVYNKTKYHNYIYIISYLFNISRLYTDKSLKIFKIFGIKSSTGGGENPFVKECKITVGLRIFNRNFDKFLN